VDDDGEFNDVRRYREFHALADILRIRWPGCYVPSIPEKKMVGSDDTQFVEERRELLERFMKEIAKYDYIVFSKEFKVFARGKGEIDKVLYALPKQTPMQVLEKYRLNFKVDENKEESEILQYKEAIANFQKFLKRVITIMENQKKILKTQV
jgi:sorting nexin-1/2|tara:strand:- start:670 stop:1125 length:456 start_codon:yes stop_codon:yes gene_type:complete